MDGYFIRKVLSRSQGQDLTKSDEFFKDVIEEFLKSNSQGELQAAEFRDAASDHGYPCQRQRGEAGDQ